MYKVIVCQIKKIIIKIIVLIEIRRIINMKTINEIKARVRGKHNGFYWIWYTLSGKYSKDITKLNLQSD